MATRFYLPSSGAAPASPAVDAFWDLTDPGFNRFKAVTTRINSSMFAHTIQEDTPTDVDQDWVFAQWVSEPLAAQTISAQTVEIQMRGRENASGNNMFLAWSIRVCSGDGSTIRGTLVAGNRDATELAVSASTLTNRRDTATSSSLAVEAGDRIVIEIGTGGNPDAGATHGSTISYGDDSSTDLPENDTETAANNPWVEFPNTISFQAAAPFPPFKQREKTLLTM